VKLRLGSGYAITTRSVKISEIANVGGQSFMMHSMFNAWVLQRSMHLYTIANTIKSYGIRQATHAERTNTHQIVTSVWVTDACSHLIATKRKCVFSYKTRAHVRVPQSLLVYLWHVRSSVSKVRVCLSTSGKLDIQGIDYWLQLSHHPKTDLIYLQPRFKAGTYSNLTIVENWNNSWLANRGRQIDNCKAHKQCNAFFWT